MPANLILTPNRPDLAPWANLAGLGSVDVAFDDGPAGAHDAFQLSDLDGTNVTGYGQPVTVPADTLERIGYVWVKRNAITTHYACIDLRYGLDPLAPDRYGAVIVDHVNGAVTPRGGGWAPPTYGITAWDANWWQVYLTLVNNAYTKLTLTLSPAFNANASGTPNVGASGGMTFWTPTLFAGSTPAPRGRGNFYAQL